MNKLKRLALIAAGYALSVCGGLAAVAANELFMPADVAQGSPGMAAFGDIVLFVLVTGFFGLAPTCFLLKLLVEAAPRTLLAAELLIAALGPVSWLAMTAPAAATPVGGPSGLPNWPQAAQELLGLFIPFGAIARIVCGPVVLVIEGVTFLLVQGRIARALLAAAMAMDLVPLGIFALHVARAARY
jgi:hypothetical protein